MISWHRVGQKVAPRNCQPWVGATTGNIKDGPAESEVCTVKTVRIGSSGRVVFDLVEYAQKGFWAEEFCPVYPTIIDQLRKLDAPSPELERDCDLERVKEVV